MSEQTKRALFDEKKFRACLPSEMLREKRWVRYFLTPKADGHGTAKIPIGINKDANHSDPKTWDYFHDCAAVVEQGKHGIGYNFLGGDIHGLDIDHCRNPKTGAICNEAMVLLSRLPSWAEYSVSGQGIHLLFKGNVRGKQLSETCLQYWNPKNSPRFFALTCDMVGEAFTKLKDVGDEFNYIFATARHISAKIREELKTVDPEQYAALPVERVQPETEVREKPKTKSRKLHKDFDLEDFLKFYGLEIDNVTTNSIGKCYRLTSCPIKGEKHVGQNSTTTNFILSNDGGLGFHCQSTGCVDYQVSQVLTLLAEQKGPYPKPVYEVKGDIGIFYSTYTLSEVEEEPLTWLWPEYLPMKQLVHFMGLSSEGKSPVSQDLTARVTAGAQWPDSSKSDLGPRTVLLMSSEDNLKDTVKPRIRLAGGDDTKVRLFKVAKRKDDLETPIGVAIDRDIEGLKREALKIADLALIVIDPITNYLGSAGMNKEDDIRNKILMPLVDLARGVGCCIVTVGHLNKREVASVLQKGMGATAFTGVPRKVFLFSHDPDDQDKYTHVMKEDRDKQVAMKYRTVKAKDEKHPSGVIQIEWLGAVDRDADEMINQPKQREKSVTEDAINIVKSMLRNGAKRKKAEIDQAVRENGIDPQKLEWSRIKRRCKVEANPLPGKGAGWEWHIPTTEQGRLSI